MDKQNQEDDMNFSEEMKEKIEKHFLPIARLKLDYSIPLLSYDPIETAADAVNLIADYIACYPNEHDFALYCDSENRPICAEARNIGNINSCGNNHISFTKTALLVNAANVYIFHNHPHLGASAPLSTFGNKMYQQPVDISFFPSPEDTEVTEYERATLDVFGINLVDAIITGNIRVSPEKAKNMNVDFSDKDIGTDGLINVSVFYSTRDNEAYKINSKKIRKDAFKKYEGAKYWNKCSRKDIQWNDDIKPEYPDNEKLGYIPDKLFGGVGLGDISKD